MLREQTRPPRVETESVSESRHTGRELGNFGLSGGDCSCERHKAKRPRRIIRFDSRKNPPGAYRKRLLGRGERDFGCACADHRLTGAIMGHRSDASRLRAGEVSRRAGTVVLI